MNPSWYDLLDVERDASADEVRAAWKNRIADLDPTDRRFRVLNQAAEVLLDPQRRAAYDAELAARDDAEAPEAASEEAAGAPVARGEGEPVVLEKAAVASHEPGKPAKPGRAWKLPRRSAAAAPTAGDRRLVPAWLLAALAVLTAVVVGVSTWLWFEKPSDAAVEDATLAAQSAAERAAGPILSYDAADLDQSKAAAESYLTSDFRKKYDQLFDGIVQQNAPSTQTVVKASVVGSGIVRSGADRVQVLLLVDQSRTNKAQKTPTVFKNFVTITMEKVDSDWLVADMHTA